jgi:hypothetical protein
MMHEPFTGHAHTHCLAFIVKLLGKSGMTNVRLANPEAKCISVMSFDRKNRFISLMQPFIRKLATFFVDYCHWWCCAWDPTVRCDHFYFLIASFQKRSKLSGCIYKYIHAPPAQNKRKSPAFCYYLEARTFIIFCIFYINERTLDADQSHQCRRWCNAKFRNLSFIIAICTIICADSLAIARRGEKENSKKDMSLFQTKWLGHGTYLCA